MTVVRARVLFVQFRMTQLMQITRLNVHENLVAMLVKGEGADTCYSAYCWTPTSEGL